MFHNIGKKIKTLAEIVTIIGIISSVVGGIIMVLLDGDLIVSGIMIAVFGSLGSWISSFILYAFGQLVENTDLLVNAYGLRNKENISDNEKIEKINNVNYEEMARVSMEYSGSSWTDNIENLSTETLQERMDNEDWEYDYRLLCRKELERRQQKGKG